MTNFQKVGIFMKTFGQEVKNKAELGDEKLNQLRISLINEELDESLSSEMINFINDESEWS